MIGSLVRRGARELADRLVETTAGLRFPAKLLTDDGAAAEYGDLLYDGALGAVLALEAASALSPRAPWQATAERTFRDAAAALRVSEIRHGLHAGDGGFVTTALQIAHLRRDRSALEHALVVGDALRAAPFVHADLLGGAAGSGIAFLQLYRATGDARWRAAVLTVVEFLGDRALPQQSGVAWHWGAGEVDHSDDLQTGFAHGSAGVVSFLADAFALGIRTKATRTLLREASRWLDAMATWDEGGGSWPSSTLRPHARRHHWCHGSTGIARAYLARARTGESGALDRACAAGGHAWAATLTSLAQADSGEKNCHCHGTAGLIELCMDLDQSEAGGPWRRRAVELARHIRSQVGGGRRPSMLGSAALGCGTGLAGVVLVLSRLAGATIPAPDRVDAAPVLRALLRTRRRAPREASPPTALATRLAPLVAPAVSVPMKGFPHRRLEVVPYRESERVAATARIIASDAGAPLRGVVGDLEQGFRGLGRRFPVLLASEALSVTTHRALLRDLLELLVLTPASSGSRAHRLAVAHVLVRRHLEALARLLTRLDRDVRGCLADRVQGPLRRITPMRGEPHRGQQRVCRIEFAEGPALAYKPRDVRVDWHVTGANQLGGLESGAQLINHALRRSGLASRIPMHDIVPGGDDYGYAEWIDAPRDRLPRPSARRPASLFGRLPIEPYVGLQLRDAAAATHFWRSAGATAFQLTAFGVADMHRENLLVGSSRSGGRPALHAIDLENAFCDLESLSDTGLVPAAGNALDPKAPRDHSHVGLDVRLPAFCDFGDHEWAFPESDGELQPPSDAGRISSSSVLNGVCNPDGSSGHTPYLGPMIRGVVDVWLALRSIRRPLGEQLARTTRDVATRVLMKHTETYMPPWRARMTGSSRGLDRLGTQAYPAAPFAPEERAQLDGLDVPVFHRRLPSPEMLWSRGGGRDEALSSLVPPQPIAESPAKCVTAASSARQLARAVVDLAAFELAQGPLDIGDEEHGVRIVRARESKGFDVVVRLPDGPAQVSLLDNGRVLHSGLPSR